MSDLDPLSHGGIPLAIRFTPIRQNKLSLWRRQSLIVIRLNASRPR